MVSTELRFFSGSSTWRASSPAQASRAVIVCDLDTLSIDARWESKIKALKIDKRRFKSG